MLLPVTSSGMGGIGVSPSMILPGSHCVGFFMDGETAQQPVIMGTISAKAEEKSKNKNKGFRDPNGIYPRYKKGESDVNRLARGDSNKTVVKWRKDNLDEADKAGGGSFKEPSTPFAAKYPYNHVFESEPKPGEDVSDSDSPSNSGHLLEFDDTPGAERVYLQHKKGNFIEWHPDGIEVHKVQSERYVIIEEDDHLHIKGDGILTVDGDWLIKIDGDCKLEISGDMKHNVDGDYKLTVGGDYKIDVGGSLKAIASNIKLNANKIDLN